jgi:polar amino acid transport system substrate-binding protein
MMRKRFTTSLTVLALLGFIAGTAAAEVPGRASADTSKPSVASAPSVKRTGSTKLADVDDLAGKRIGALQGSAYVEYVGKTWPRATLLQFNTPADLLLAVKTGKVDAALSDAEPLRAMLRADETLGVLGEPLFSFPEAAGFRKNNDALRGEFNSFLAALKQSGVHAEMIDRWMERERDRSRTRWSSPATFRTASSTWTRA